MGNTGAFHWEKVNGRWWAFGAEGYLSTGWIYDTLYQGWFYMDENQGMLTGWQFINGKWYYLNSNQMCIRDSRQGDTAVSAVGSAAGGYRSFIPDQCWSSFSDGKADGIQPSFPDKGYGAEPL